MMGEIATKEVLKAAGFSARLITVVLVIGGAFYIYKTYLETTKTKLQIAALRREAAAAENN